MQNFLNKKNRLNDNNKQITYRGEKIIEVLQEINYILCSLHDMSSYYQKRDTREYEKETTRFIDNSLVCNRLALIRKVLTEQFDLTEGDDGLDDVERACEDIMYWSKPGDYSNETWIK